MAEVAGTFRIMAMGAEEGISEDSGRRLTHASGGQEFVGGIAGTGRVNWLMCYSPDKAAEFVGLQEIDGTLDGRRGSFVLASVGRHDGSASHGTWSVVAGSGSDDLEGIAGAGEWDAGPGPEGTYRLNYTG